MGTMKRSVIEEEDMDEDEDSDEDRDFSQNQMLMMDKKLNIGNKTSIARKKAVRNTLRQGEGLLSKLELSKREFGILIQKSILSIFEGCHKNVMKSTLAMRAILYEV